MDTTPLVMTDERRPDRRNNERNAKRTLLVLSLIVAGMFGFAYANAPFFALLCRKIGILPEELKQTEALVDAPDGKRPLRLLWMANAGSLPIAFTVKESYQEGFVGQRGINEYRFVNLSDRTIYFRPVHSILPISAGNADVMQLEKCFCFDEQKILPRQEYTLPVVFRFDPKLDAAVDQITMSYQLFESSEERYLESLKQGSAKKGPVADGKH